MPNTTVELVVERTSPFGFMSAGKWYNPCKYKKPNLSGVKPGDKLSVTLNAAGFVIAVSGATGVARAAGPASGPTTYTKGASDNRTEIARSTAIKSVFGSPILYDIYKDTEDKTKVAGELMELTKQITNYILTGEFPSSSIPKVAEVEDALPF